MLVHIISLEQDRMHSLEKLQSWAVENNLPKYRAKQIYQAVTKNLISNWDEALELPKELREFLKIELPISELKIKKVLPDADAINRVPTGAPTIKVAFETKDNLVIESVLMRHERERNTVCVSTQVGCAMNCSFCATGKMGFKRNLTAEEIVDQVLEFSRMLKMNQESRIKNQEVNNNIHNSSFIIHDSRITNIVFMGMGEPFLNYENTMEAIKILNDNQGFNLGIRHMTISTAGIVPEILRFADENIQVNLAISLHAPNDKIRSELMPINKKYPLEKLLPAVSEYMNKNNRKVFFEYILLQGINDSGENIYELIDLMKKYFPEQMHLVHINLIEYNEIDSVESHCNVALQTTQKDRTRHIFDLRCNLQSPTKDRTRRVFDLLQKNGILATVRYKFGQDIAGGCGQLAGG